MLHPFILPYSPIVHAEVLCGRNMQSFLTYYSFSVIFLSFLRDHTMCALKSCRTRNRSSYNGTSRHNKATLLLLCLQAGHKFLSFQVPRSSNLLVSLPHRQIFFSRCCIFSEYFHFSSSSLKFISILLCMP
jgi:hypothetical protein